MLDSLLRRAEDLQPIRVRWAAEVIGVLQNEKVCAGGRERDLQPRVAQRPVITIFGIGRKIVRGVDQPPPRIDVE